MALAYRCPDCLTNWPYAPRYTRCPECRERTSTIAGTKALTLAEANDRLKRLEFIRFCNQRDEKRERLGHPSPEQIGEMEAAEIRRQLAEIRELPGVSR